MIIDRKYGTQDDVYFPLITRDASDFLTAAPFAAGDVKVIKDGAAAANTTNLPAETAAGSKTYKLTLTGTELTAKKVQVVLVDQTATKAWEDQSLVIETYGHANAQHPFDRGTATVALLAAERDAIASALFKLDLSTVTGEARRSLLNFIRKGINRWTNLSGVLTVYKEDDTTVAYTEATDEVTSTNVVTGSDPV